MQGAPISVLLVDDDADDAFLTRELISDVASLVCTVHEVHDADAAIHQLLTRTYDVCLLDFRLGAQTGLDVLKAVVAAGCDTPCILLTGQDDAETDRAALVAGAVDYLVKGRFDGDGLVRTIRYAIKNMETVRSLRTSEQRFRSLFDSATDAILVVAENGEIRSWNPRAEKLFELTASKQRSFRSLFQLDQSFGEASVSALLFQLRDRDRINDAHVFELLGSTSSGREFSCEVTMSDWTSDEGRSWTAIVRDVSERKVMEERLVHQAFHDPLTNLANRALFRSRVEQGITRLGRTPGCVGVLFCDLDDFKRINDTLGHAAGDELLTVVVHRILRCIRSSDTAARLGGDEFAILVEDSDDPHTALHVADRLLAEMQRPVVLSGREVVVSASVGIAIATDDTTDAEELLRNADLAMYSAKSAGKGRYAVFEGAMHETVMHRLHLESDLRKAIEDGDIAVHYQPIVRLPGNELRGFEALAHWNHPDRGIVAPTEFIPLAEELGLISAIGRHVLHRACLDLKTWQQASGRSDLGVSVNISVRQLEDDSLRDIVAGELAYSGIDPASLVLEITESAMAQDPALIATRLATVAELGVRIAIDDFGTGYSSLSYLRDLPVHILKVDRSFVERMNEVEGRGGALVRAIVAMAHSLGLEAIAEGVENGAQQSSLVDCGCDFGQGFLFARPLSRSDTDAFLLSLGSPLQEAMPA